MGVAPLAKNIVQTAHQYLGIPYVYGGDNPSSGLDCSGFLQNVYKQMGVNLGRTTYQQFRQGRAVGLRQLKPGDAVFTVPTKAGPDHVGMYVGHGMVQESPHTGTKNSLIPLKSFLGDGFVGARRYGNYAGGPIQNAPMQPGRSGTVGNHANELQALQLITGVLGSHNNSTPTTAQADPFQVQLGLPSNG
jgi:cell wall-associated NlpC family hydrolase